MISKQDGKPFLGVRLVERTVEKEGEDFFIWCGAVKISSKSQKAGFFLSFPNAQVYQISLLVMEED